MEGHRISPAFVEHREPALGEGPDLTAEEVRDRFSWASRQGRPQWLWPDVEFDDCAAALDSIETAASEILRGGRPTAPLAGNPAALGIAGYVSGMGPLVGGWLEDGLLTAPQAEATVFARHLAHNRRRMRDLAARSAAISTAFSRHGVCHTFLKGMHTAFAYFAEPGRRPMADIDLLVDRAQKPEAARVLRELGFEPGLERAWPPEQEWRLAGTPTLPSNLSLVHEDDPWTIDLHWSLDRRPVAGSKPICLDAALSAAGRERWPVSELAFVLPRELLALHLAVHASCSLASLTLIRQWELAEVVRQTSAAGAFCWDQSLRLAAVSGSLGNTFPALHLCRRLAPGAFPQAVVEQARRAAPARVRTVADKLTPARAQGLTRYSLAERFMWAPSSASVVREMLDAVFPQGTSSLSGLTQAYRNRAWRAVRGTWSR